MIVPWTRFTNDVGMAKDIVENSSKAKKLIKEANDILGFDISKVMFEGPVEKLKQTDITQPAIFIHSVILHNLIDGLTPDVVAGHSLGEYSALVAAQAINFEKALELVRARGVAMLEAGEKQKGTMAAIIGLDFEKVNQICEEISHDFVVQPANFNSPGKLLLLGPLRAFIKQWSCVKVMVLN